MAVIAIKIHHPNGTPSAHLADSADSVDDLIAQVVSALGLPSGMNYEMYPMSGDEVFRGAATLEEQGVQPGAELRLVVVRDRTMKEQLDRLYAETERFVQEGQWQAAQEKLDELYSFDATYPDPLGLEEAIAQKSVPERSSPRFAAEPKNAGIQPPPAIRDTGTSAVAASEPLRLDATNKYQLMDSPGQGRIRSVGRLGCILVVVLLFAVAVGAGMLLYSPDLWPGIVRVLGLDLSLAPGTTLGTGDVQVTLRWTGTADLDLRVAGPTGDEVGFDAPKSESGGILDVDANGGCTQLGDSPVENIYWPDDEAEAGTYVVWVVYFQDCAGAGVTEYEVTVRRNREILDVISGQIGPEDGEIVAAEFEYVQPQVAE